MKSSPLRNIIILLIITALIAAIYSIWLTGQTTITDITISELVSEIETGKVQEITVKSNRLDITLDD
ncbi:ATP-dependent metallopeptidase FtsH/Yme1/Tma family protein, partial [Patescibacteria group bacterium]|nr:ATP-dependent metallopeptidase FtsH/Yme1/Tma family protein [Patescibacteria group bacterium]